MITVEAAGLPESDHEKLVATLSKIAGVARVVVVELRQPPATAPAAASPLPTTAPRRPGRRRVRDSARGLELLPKGLLFRR